MDKKRKAPAKRTRSSTKKFPESDSDQDELQQKETKRRKIGKKVVYDEAMREQEPRAKGAEEDPEPANGKPPREDFTLPENTRSYEDIKEDEKKETLQATEDVEMPPPPAPYCKPFNPRCIGYEVGKAWTIGIFGMKAIYKILTCTYEV